MRRKKGLCLLVCLGTSVIWGCAAGSGGTGGGNGGAGVGGGQNGGAQLPLPANPLSVGVTPDDARAASALVKMEGGAVSATGGDGTVFTLMFPADALLSDETITLTPVSTVTGLPFAGGLMASVQLGPDGLQLVKPATLTIHTGAGTDALAMVGFGYRTGGAEFHLYPWQTVGPAVTLQLTHFSGYGVGVGSPDEASGDTPTAVEDQALQQLAAVAKALVDRGPGAAYTADEQAKIEAILRAWYSAAVGPQLSAAETDDTLLDDAVAEFLDWYRQAQLFLGSDAEQKFSQELQASYLSLTTGIGNALPKARDRYVASHDLAELGRMLRWVRLGALLGLDAYGLDLTTAWNVVRKSATYELDFVSDIVATTAAGPIHANLHGVVTMTVPDSAEAYFRSGKELSGSGSLDYVSFSYPNADPNHCTDPVDSKAGSELTVLSLAWDQGLNIRGLSLPPAILLVLNTGHPLEHVFYTCFDNQGNQTPVHLFDTPTGMWETAFMPLHADELNELLGGYMIANWSYTTGAGFGVKVYRRSLGTLTEDTALTITHSGE